MTWYKKSKFYGGTVKPSGEDQPRPVYVKLKDGTQKQIEDVMIVPETYDDFKGTKSGEEHGKWVGWGVAVKEKNGWSTKKWFINDWEAEDWAQKRWPNG